MVLNDIGLIRVNSDIQFDENVKKIKLETDEKKNYDNTNATVLGWGRKKVHFRLNIFAHLLCSLFLASAKPTIFSNRIPVLWQSK